MGRFLGAGAHLRASGQVLRAVMRNPALRRVELAFLLYNSVEFGTWVAVLLYAYEATGPASVGLVAVAQLLPAAIVAPFAALVADRSDRLRALAAGYVLQTVAVGATAAGILLEAPPPLVYLAAAAVAGSLTLTRPTQGALLPELSRTPEELSAANAVSGTVEGAGVFLGPLAAALILTFGGPGLVFASGTVAILGAALLVSSVAISVHGGGRSRSIRPEPVATVAVATHPAAAAARGILEGVRILLANGEIRLVVLLLGLRAMVSGAMDVLFVLLALEVFHTGDPGAAILNGSLGIGMVLGGAFSFVLIGRRRLAPAMGVAACVLGGALVAAAVFGSAVNAPFLILLGGVGYATSDVAGRTILQRTADDAVLGRVLGTLESIGLFGLAIGSLMAPTIAAAAGIEWALTVAGLLLPLGILLGWRGLHHIDEHTRVPERELELLQRSPVFAALPPPALEMVARHVRWLAVDPGTTVIVEGERGDAYFVIERGRFRVEQAGVPLRVLDRPVDGFGEIALLRDTPRTATVIAEEPSVLLVISRDDFLAAVTGSAPARTVAEGIAQERG